MPDAVEESHETTDHGLPPEPAAELEGEVVVVEADDESVPASEALPTADAAGASSDEATEVSSSASASSTNDQATPAPLRLRPRHPEAGRQNQPRRS